MKFPAILDTSLLLLSKSFDFHFPCLNGCWEYPQLQLILIYIPTLQLLFSEVVLVAEFTVNYISNDNIFENVQVMFVNMKILGALLIGTCQG